MDSVWNRLRGSPPGALVNLLNFVLTSAPAVNQRSTASSNTQVWASAGSESAKSGNHCEVSCVSVNEPECALTAKRHGRIYAGPGERERAENDQQYRQWPCGRGGAAGPRGRAAMTGKAPR